MTNLIKLSFCKFGKSLLLIQNSIIENLFEIIKYFTTYTTYFYSRSFFGRIVFTLFIIDIYYFGLLEKQRKAKPRKAKQRKAKPRKAKQRRSIVFIFSLFSLFSHCNSSKSVFSFPQVIHVQVHE